LITSVELVRKIRDSEYEETKNMNREEFIQYINESSRTAFDRLAKLPQGARRVADVKESESHFYELNIRSIRPPQS
jgi:hypothetical protein